jgi:hypothetical protein
MKNGNPYNKGNLGIHPLQVFNKTISTGKGSKESTIRAKDEVKPIPVQFPLNLYTPDGAQDVDLRRVCIAEPLTTAMLWSYSSPQGAMTRFTHYAVFTDAQFADEIEFIPRINGNRILQYHGDPIDFKIKLGLGPDLGEDKLIQCNITLKPGETLTWTVEYKNTEVNTSVGVRMKGYIDRTQIIKSDIRFGG